MSGTDNYLPLLYQKYTNAKVGLETAGTSLTTETVLDFKEAHAKAKDAIYTIFEIDEISKLLDNLNLPAIRLKSAATDRNTYLKRPDKGRILSQHSKEILENNVFIKNDLSIIIADGLSATALHRHSIPFIKEFTKLNNGKYLLAPICIVENGRVAIGDEIGSRLGAAMTVLLIGERPGLSAPDSMGIYITYNPSPGKTDEQRNCISNIHARGLTYKDAAEKLLYIIEKSFYLKLSGVELKDDQTNVGQIEGI